MINEESHAVTVIIPSSRVPDAAMLNFWLKLTKFSCVAKVIFVANGSRRHNIVDILNRQFRGTKSVEICDLEIGSAPRARNIGLERADTPYVHFLDDDDQILPDFYEQTTSILEDKKLVGVAVSTHVYIDGNTDNSYLVTRVNRTIRLKVLLIDNLLGVTSGVILRTSAVKEVGGFDQGMPARQDYDLWLRLAKIGDFRLLSEPLLLWTEHRTRPSIRNSTSIDSHDLAIEKLMELKRSLGWADLPFSQRRRGMANHYKYLAVMSQLSNGKTPWGHVLRSIVAYPQAKPILMLMPEGATKVARKAITAIRRKNLGGAQYGTAERRLALFLAKSPQVKRVLKYLYQGAFYLLHSGKGSDFDVTCGDLSEISVPGFEDAEAFFGYYDRLPENGEGQLLVHTLVSGECQLNIIGDDGSLVASIPTRAWNHQQGALPCWIDDFTVAFNDCKNGYLRTGLLKTLDGDVRYLEGSFQAFSRETGYLASININLINKLRPEYGFRGVDPLFSTEDQLLAFRSLEDPKVDISFVTVAKMAKVTGLSLPVGNTKINHVVFSPNGQRVTFLLRYFKDKVKHTVQVIHDFENDSYQVVQCGDVVSHYCWIDSDWIAIWGENKEGARGYLLTNMAGEVKKISLRTGGFSNGDGHPTLVPGTEYLISDTYPDKAGMSHLYRFSWKSGTERKLASFFQPFRFRGPKRIDLHPRYSPVSGNIYFDSGHSGQRGAYKLKTSEEREVTD